MKMKSIIISVLVMLLLLPSGIVLGQYNNNPQQQQQQKKSDISDKELKKFKKIQDNIQPIQKESQQKMINAVKENGLDVQSYNEINKQLRENEETSDIAAEKKKKFKQAKKDVTQVQQELQNKIQKEAKKENMTMKRYEEIFMAVRQNPELQRRMKRVQN